MSITILLNVYNLHSSNVILSNIGIGAFHTGVEIKGKEYSFSQCGVVVTAPKLQDFGEFKEQIIMGEYIGTLLSIQEIMLSWTENGIFSRGVYDMANRNCNHFSDQLCFTLVNRHIPDWINRLSSIGAGVSTGKSPPPTASSSQSNNSLAPLGTVKTPSSPVALKETSNQQPIPGTSSSVFGWIAYLLDYKPATAEVPVVVDNNQKNKKKVLTEKQKDLLNKLKK
jgi:hypothetical protein